MVLHVEGHHAYRRAVVEVDDGQATHFVERAPALVCLDAARAFEGMKARGVLVKNVSRMHPLLAECLRLTVGTAEENAQMLAALQSTL